jgi:hypothetical protein
VGVSGDPLGIASMQNFRVEAPGFSICVAADCPRTLQRIERYLLPWLPRTRSSHDAPEIAIVLRRNPQADYFAMELNGAIIAANETMPYLFTLIQQAADDAMVRHLRRETAIHAGTVVYQGEAIVMPGPSGSGKSRLVQELLRLGAEYCSDEYAILDSRGCVHPYARALMIREESEEQHPMLASDLRAKVCDCPSPVSLFLFLRYDADAEGLDVQPLDRSEALIRLLQNTPQVMADKYDVLAPLKAAMSQAASYEGTRGEVPRAAVEILQLAANAS